MALLLCGLPAVTLLQLVGKGRLLLNQVLKLSMKGCFLLPKLLNAVELRLRFGLLGL